MREESFEMLSTLLEPILLNTRPTLHYNIPLLGEKTDGNAKGRA